MRVFPDTPEPETMDTEVDIQEDATVFEDDLVLDQEDDQKLYYHIDEGTTSLYHATENPDGTWTVSNGEGESMEFSAEDFHTNFMEYHEPGDDESLEMGALSTGFDSTVIPDPEGGEQIDLENIRDLDTAKAAIHQLLAMHQQNQSTVPVGTSEQRIQSAAERLITGLAALGTGVFKGVGQVVGDTVNRLNAWQGQQRLLEMETRLNAAKDHLDTIKSDPDFLKEIQTIETGVKSDEDVRAAFYERFISDEPQMHDSDLNRAYHGLMTEMKSLSDFDFGSAVKKIDLRDDHQRNLAAKVDQGLTDLLDRDELNVLPDANNEELRKSIEEMVKRVRDFFRGLIQRITNSSQAQDSSGMDPA